MSAPAQPESPTPLLLDVRPDLARGQEPFGRIMETARGVPEGGAFVLVAPFEPVPLYGVLGKQGFSHVTESLGLDGFKVTFTRGGDGPRDAAASAPNGPVCPGAAER